MKAQERLCPWCKEPYDRFIPHSTVDEQPHKLPENACESELGFWVHETDQ